MGLFRRIPKMEDKKCPSCGTLMSKKQDVEVATEGKRIPGFAILGPVAPVKRTYYKLIWECPKCGYVEQKLAK